MSSSQSTRNVSFVVIKAFSFDDIAPPKTSNFPGAMVLTVWPNLANTLGRYDIPLLKDEIILSGSLVPLEPAIPGDKFEMKINGLGSCKVVFKE